jgi:hypothetical protein
MHSASVMQLPPPMVHLLQPRRSASPFFYFTRRDQIARLAHRDRIALETYRDARTAMALIREAVEDCAPPGSVPREDYLTPEFTVQAEALVRGIYAIAGRSRRS